ncbi:MAG: hypothetical protein QOF17_962 [Solirubrobacteraceae bacterium]|jgi:hypothetical protein|nr:hypothetical protein [Solirubrobacteraceae bacterium]
MMERVANAVIADPKLHTVMEDDGAVRSIQAADVTMPEEQLDAIWTPTHLERLARTYWKYLSRVSLGLIRVRYTADERAVVLIGRPFVLLRFHAPEYLMSRERGIVRWRIRDGLLVAVRDHGYLEIDVRRLPADRPGFARAHVEVEVANFYPALSLKLARWVYAQTQSRIHVLVTHGFLRSLAALKLEESAVGRFAVPAPEGQEPLPAPDGGAVAPARQEPVTVGDTPWRLVIALSAAWGIAAAALLRRLRR